MLVRPQSTDNFAKSESGGKGYNLYLLSKAGLPVPDWVVFGRRYYHQFIWETGIKSQIDTWMQDFAGGILSAKDVEAKIHELLIGTPPTPTLTQKLDEALGHQPSMYSVRSSAADEDSGLHSFAGQLSSFLYLKSRNEILISIRKCWASAFSERSLVYRKENGLPLADISVAVVLQKMIDPQKSGVLFTCDPVEQKPDQYVISSVYGVGEGLVSGQLDADSFWVSASTFETQRSEIVNKAQKFTRGPEGHCEVTPVPPAQQDQPSLTPEELKALAAYGKKIHDLYHRPQDIEWAIQDGQIYILQTRPITSLDQNLFGYPNLWDNSNIVESYGGITSPLSFSFALRNYRAVYVQFCEVLGVPNDIIKDMDSYLGYMLGHLNGRVYYNLFNWYKLVGVLPGFEMNMQFMETMMGVGEGLSDELRQRIEPHPSWKTWKGKLRRFVTGMNFLRYHFTIQSVVDDFLKTFNRDYNYYRSLPLRSYRGDQLVYIYMDIERNMLGRWKAPIINDFLCMVHFGLLRKLTATWLANLDSTIQNDLLSGEGGLESAEPTRELMRLAIKVSKNPDLRKLIETTEPTDGLEALNQSRHQEFYKDVLSYIDRFGFRCMSEMKLEEIDLVTDPSFLFTNLKNYLKSGKLQESDAQHERQIREDAEKKVAGHLKGFRKIFYFWVLKHARKAVKNRENTRFARTRIYGLARTIFQTVGSDLNAQGILEHHRDVFWITIEEVFGIYNGTLPSYALKELVTARKRQFDTFHDEIDARIFTRGPVYWNNPFIKEVTAPEIDDPNCDLKGLPCCPGVLEGTVKVIMSPKDDLNLNGEILVTARTDPGWVPLYPSISGLLVERGSLLSHSAIVAREMGIPTIVSIPGLTKKLKTGMKIRMDGKAGTIQILAE